MRKNTILKQMLVICMVLNLLVLVACGTQNNSASSPNKDNTSNNANQGKADVSSDKQPVIGISVISLTSPFYVTMKEAGDVAAKDYDVKTIWQSADNSLEKQISAIENFIQQKVNVIMIDPIDAKGIVPVIQKAKSANIPVVTMGNKVEGDWNYNTLYPDYENMATIAKAIGLSLEGKGEVAYLTGAAGNYVSDTREKAFVETMKKDFPDIKVVGIQPTNWDPAQAQKVTEAWLNNYPNLNAIVFMTDPVGLAAISVAEAKGKKLVYGGVDIDETTKPYMKNGSLVIDVLTGAGRVGYWNVAAGARIAKGTKFPTDLFMPTYFVIEDKKAESLKAKGLEVKRITVEEAMEVASKYSEEFGPNQPNERISGE